MLSVFSDICAALGLGVPLCPPMPLTDGLTHRMFSLITDQGRYAVKLLNPEIMQRPGVLENYARAEAFETLLEQRGLPILPALTLQGRKMHCIDGQYLYVFEYFDGRPLHPREITPAHCRKIGAALARIHETDRRERTSLAPAPVPIDWHALTDALLADGESHEAGLMMGEALPLLLRATAAAEEAQHRLPPIEALCHNDMDPKNVLWRGEDFRIIDLECLGHADPAQEMMDLAISWSGEPFDETRFLSFVGSYLAAGGQETADLASCYDSRRNYLDWLAYNAARAFSADEQEHRMACEQIVGTVEKVRSDLANRERVLKLIRLAAAARQTSSECGR